MDINYLILAHKNPEQLSRLVRVLKSDQVYFYIHIDKNVEISPFKEKIQEKNDVRFIPDEKRKATPWGDIGAIEATLTMLEEVVKDNRNGYCVLLSGQDYPLRTNKGIRAFFQKYNGCNFIELFQLPSKRWFGDGLMRISAYKINLSGKRGDFILLPSVFDKRFFSFKTVKKISKAFQRRKLRPLIKLFKKRSFPEYLKPFGGEHWWALQTDTIKKILLFLDLHPDYIKFHEDTLCVDEIFFQTLIGNLFVDYQELIKPKVMYVNWSRKGAALPVTFSQGDLEELKEASSSFLFARKFDAKIDSQILDFIDQNLLNNNQLFLHPFNFKP